MKFKSIFLLIFVICIIFSLSSVVATDDINSSLESTCNDYGIGSLDQSSEIELEDNLNSITEDDQLSAQYEEVLTTGTVKTIYVGHTNTSDGGNGSKDNPFTTFKAARDSVNGEDTVNIYVYNGTYKLAEGMSKSTTPLIFNTNNLNIIGINGSVIIKNYFNEKSDCAEAFSLSSSSANFTFSNLVFDASGVTYANINEKGELPPGITPEMAAMMGLEIPDMINYFSPFYGQINSGNFNNCSFVGFNLAFISYELNYNSNFINCYFEVKKDYTALFYKISDINLCFEKCIFDFSGGSGLSTYFHNNCNISMKDMWFGKNSLSFPMPSQSNFYPDVVVSNVISVTRYAIFDVTQNYLGNDEYEIIGKLTWNGTDEQGGIENFQSMTVTLLSENGGEIISSVPLVNGSFKTIYKNAASTHHITAILHNQDIDLEFTTVNITANEVSVKYGEDQNITVNLSQAIDNNVTITVSNATYNKSYVVKVNDTDSFTFTIPDRLKAGTYNVNITLNNGTLFGFNTSILTVSKVSDYKFDVVPSSNVKVGDTATIIIILPDDVNGTVTVKFGNETQSLPANSSMAFNFTNLKAITYSVNVTYSGNDKYTSKSISDSVTVDKADSSLEINNAVFTYGDVITIPFSVTNANGVTVSVLNKDEDEVANTSSNSNIITLDALPAGEYTLYVRTVVDKDNYNWVDKSPKLTINKANSSLIVSDKEFTYATEAIINAVTVNSTGNVIATLYDENNNKIAVTVSGDNITLPLINTGKYTLTVTTNVDENHTNVTKTATVTIVKATPSISVDVFPENETFEGNEITLDVKLSGDATGLVLVDITDNNKLFDELNNSAVKFTLNNLVAGDYAIKVTYLGDNNYNSANKTVNIKVNAKEESNANITIPDDIKIGGDNNVKIDLPQNANGTVTLIIDGKVISTTPVVNGSANVSLDNLTSGNHIVEIAYSGDDKYAPASSTKIVKIEKQNVVIVADKSFTRAAVDYNAGERGAMFYAILKDANGNLLVNKTVQVAYNAEIYNKITDNQGRVGLQVNIAKAGTYPITISFAGDDTYNASPLTLAKLTVTKKKTTIKASNKVFKAKKKSKKISVTLKTVKNPYDKKIYLKSGKKVTLKVKGKTYTAKINKKGVAKFTIKLTKKGKYKAKIKFAGDDTYKASGKTIKIRIK